MSHPASPWPALIALSSRTAALQLVLELRERPAARRYGPDRPATTRLPGGTVGNQRLTGSTAALLLLLLAAEGATILAIRPLLSVHVFIGMLLIPPVALKLASSGYRFVRYYTGNATYRADGPPQPLLRMSAPLLVAATAGLFASGVALLVVGPAGGPWRGLHTASFVIWFGAMVVHVLGHVVRVPALASADWRSSERLPGSALRRWLLCCALVAGLTLALATLPLARPWLSWVKLAH